MHIMSSVFSKSREKRARTSSGESNNSFVKNVTSRMSGLLPATITKWFSNSSSSSTNGSAPLAEITDSSSDDEVLESPSATPPSKRRRISSPVSQYSSIKTANASTETTSEETLESMSTSVLYRSIQTSKNNPRQDANYIPTPFRNATSESTTTERNDEVPCHSKSPPTAGIFRQSMAPRKSIFDLAPSSKKEKIISTCAKTVSSAPKDPKAPCFNPSLLGSPFYAGRTMYGGASTSTYINQPNIKQRKIAKVNESKNSDTVNMSYSARQVMDLLENFTSPLVEARRIPVISRNPNVSHPKILDSSLPSTSSTNMNFKTQELYVPSIASILRLKQRSRLMDTTKVARQIIASHSSTLSNFQPYVVDNKRQEYTDNRPRALEKEPAKSDITPKMKTRLTRRNRDMIDSGSESTETVELPTAVLQIDTDNLPKFTFGVSSQPSSAIITAKTTYTQTPSDPITFNNASTTSEGATVSGIIFKFSSPVKILDPQPGDVSPPAFKFGSPERRVDNNSDSSNRLAISPIIDNNNKESQSASVSDWKCSDCWVLNKSSAEKCLCCGAKQPKLPNDTKQSTPISNSGSIFSTGLKPSANWSCPDCWVSNPQANEKCLCCGAHNPTKTAAPSIPKSDTLGKDWKCEDCWISNKSIVDKCAACGGAKPGTKPTGPSLPVNSFESNISKPLVKDQKDNLWQCQTCLVNNSNEKSSCVCCGIEKSGGDKEAAKKLFNFSTNTNVSFKFGIDPKLQEEALKKSEATENAFSKITEISETNNNVVPKIQTSTFTLPTSNIFSKSEDKVEGKIPTFNFGIPKPTHTLTTEATFTVKQPEPELTTQKAEDKEKPQEVPRIDFKAPVQDANKPSGFFGPSITGKLSEQPAPTFGFFPNSTLDKDKKETLSNPISTASTLEKDEKPPTQSTFTFAAEGLKPAISMFGASVTTTAPATGITTGTPLQTPASTNSTSSLSLFQKPETTSSPISLFKYNETTISSAPSTLFQKSETTTVAPLATSIFSFGSNTQSSAVAPSSSALDKPKFNFTFGNNNTTESVGTGLFKTPFPTTTENNGNNFALPASNALANSLGNNSLSTGNGLGGNALGGNSLGGNALGGNALGGNGLGGNGLGGNGLGGNGLGGDNTMSGNVLGSSNDNNMATASIFGSSMQKDLWPNNNATGSIFGSSGATNDMATKPAPFTFGAQTQFNAGNAATNPQPAQNIFGGNTQSTPNVFAIGTQNNASQSSLFQSQPQSQPAPMFGNQNPTPSLFGTPAAPAVPFGAANQTMASGFDNTSMTPAPTPAFNFGQPQQAPAVFGFGQPAAAPQNAGVYNFGGAAAGTPQQLQFSMGSAPNPNQAVRRMRKAVRRTSQR